MCFKERRKIVAFNQWYNLPQDVKKKLPFLGQPFYYIYKNSGGKILRGILYEISNENMNKAWKRLTGETGEILSGDKVFVLPNCRIPMFKLTDYLKTAGAIQTPDVTEATKIIGSDRSLEEVRIQALGSTIIHKNEYCHFLSKWKDSYYSNTKYVQEESERFHDTVNNYEDVFEGEFNCKDTIISKAIWGGIHNFDHDTWSSDKFITPTGAWILYNHLLNKIPIVNEDSVYEKIGKPLIIDAESYETIRDMLASQDGESNKVGAELLANCDINPSLYWIWKLSRQFQYIVSNLSSFKNIRLFIQKSDWYGLNLKDPEEFTEYLYTRRLLTKEYFSELITEAAKRYTGVLQSPLFSMVVKPGKKYEEFSDGQSFVFSKDEPESAQVEVVEEEEEIDED